MHACIPEHRFYIPILRPHSTCDTRTRIHTYMHTCTHLIRTYILTYTYTYVHVQEHTSVHTDPSPRQHIRDVGRFGVQEIRKHFEGVWFLHLRLCACPACMRVFFILFFVCMYVYVCSVCVCVHMFVCVCVCCMSVWNIYMYAHIRLAHT